MRKFKLSQSLSAAALAMCFLAHAQDAGSRAAIEKQLTAKYALTKPTADNTDIVTAGAVVVLQKDNLMMAPVTGTDFYQNTFKEGKINQNTAGKVGKALGRFSRLPGASAPSAPATRTYVTGEKMWVTKIEMKEDAVIFDLFTDAVSDVRYKAALKFPFPKGIALTPEQVEKLVGEVFKVQPAEDTSNTAQDQQPAPAAPARNRKAPPPSAPAPAPAAEPPPPAPAPEPEVVIPPPPPPPADEPPPPPKTISKGQTKDQVVAIFGQPEKIAKPTATKEIYYYKDLKVTFVSGKVADVQ